MPITVRNLYTPEPGFNSWLKLPNAILSMAGKNMVTKDPDLSDETIQALVEIEPEPENPIPFFFGGMDSGNDIGFTVLSMCIHENMSASFGELVARYSGARGIPYGRAAARLNELRKRKMLFTFEPTHDGDYVPTPWEPQVIGETYFILPPSKKRPS